MPLFWRNCVFLLLFFPLSNSVPYPSSKCFRNDCFYQLPDFRNDTCKIYNTSVCRKFYNFDVPSEETSEEEANILLSIVPYTAELFVYPSAVKRSAINLTLTINSTDINELVVKISAKLSSNLICRIFDFQNVNNSNQFPINLFYDCLFNLVENKLQNVRMDFIALPEKKKLSYYVFIPGTTYPVSCTWQPLIMVFSKGLQNGEVQVKFSHAPELYNVSSYIVKLTENPSGAEKIVDVTPDKNRSMLFAQFSSVDEGIYSVSVKPVFLGVRNNCWTETDTFLVEKSKSGIAMLIIYLGIFLLLILCTLVFLKMFGHNIAKLRYGSKRQILLVYSHDCDKHEEFVLAFIDYLKKYCFVEVSTIYGDECNPLEWINQKYSDCDVIMFLISTGLFYTLDTKYSRHIQTSHEWRKQPLWATHTILLELLNNYKDIKTKKILKVCFSYSSEKEIPDRLHGRFGKCYLLPQEMNNLINKLHDSWKCFMCNKLCGIDFASPSKIAVLLEKMEAVQRAVDNNEHISIIEPLSNTINNDPKFPPDEDIDNISTTSDENSDSFTDILPGAKENFLHLSSKNTCSKIISEDYIENEPVNDSEESSDSGESDCLCDPPKLNSETEAKFLVDKILHER